MSTFTSPRKKWFSSPWLSTLAKWFGRSLSTPASKSTGTTESFSSAATDADALSRTFMLKMLAEARTSPERERAMRIAVSAGMSLTEIEQLFDQIDSKNA